MAFDLSSISPTGRARPPRIIMLGVEKIGKSTFASQAPAPIFIPIKREEGIDGIDVPQFPTCETFLDTAECLKTLLEGEHKYSTVVVDSTSALEPLIHQAVCDKSGVESIEKYDGGYGKGYTESLSYFRTLTDLLDLLRERKGMLSILIGHVKIKRFDDPTGASYDKYYMDINDRAHNALFRWADAILFANTKVLVKTEDAGFGKTIGKGKDITEGQRFLYTQQRPSHPGGGRGVYGRLPYEIPLSWNAYAAAITDVSKKEE